MARSLVPFTLALATAGIVSLGVGSMPASAQPATPVPATPVPATPAPAARQDAYPEVLEAQQMLKEPGGLAKAIKKLEEASPNIRNFPRPT